MDNEDELGTSELGTKNYWDRQYEAEIVNFRTHGDVGDIWFGEAMVEKIVKWMTKNPDIKRNDKIVDIGSGNGMLLIELFKAGFTDLYGVDYSENAVKLAQEIARKNCANIQYSVINVLSGDFFLDEFNVVLDKGTYDAISLSPNACIDRIMYVQKLYECLKSNGFLLLTSCNWTKNELNVHFGDMFEYFGDIQTPQFKFGGKIGNVVTCVVYRKKAQQK